MRIDHVVNVDELNVDGRFLVSFVVLLLVCFGYPQEHSVVVLLLLVAFPRISRGGGIRRRRVRHAFRDVLEVVPIGICIATVTDR